MSCHFEFLRQWSCSNSGVEATVDILWQWRWCSCGCNATVEVLQQQRSYNIGVPAVMEVLTPWRWGCYSGSPTPIYALQPWIYSNSGSPETIEMRMGQRSSSTMVGGYISGGAETVKILRQCKTCDCAGSWTVEERSSEGGEPVTVAVMGLWKSCNIGDPAPVEVLRQCNCSDIGSPARLEVQGLWNWWDSENPWDRCGHASVEFVVMHHWVSFASRGIVNWNFWIFGSSAKVEVLWQWWFWESRGYWTVEVHWGWRPCDSGFPVTVDIQHHWRSLDRGKCCISGGSMTVEVTQEWRTFKSASLAKVEFLTQ